MAERTPRVFLVLGICYMTLQCIGWLLISEPNEEEKKMLEEESKPLQTEQETLMESPRPQGMTPKEAAKTSRFWEIWLVLMFVSIANNFVSSFYKVTEPELLNGSSSASRSSRTTCSSSRWARSLRSATVSAVFSGE